MTGLSSAQSPPIPHPRQPNRNGLKTFHSKHSSSPRNHYRQARGRQRIGHDQGHPRTENHVNMLKSIFGFPAIKALMDREDLSVIYDSMHGVNVPFAKAVFVDHPESFPRTTPTSRTPRSWWPPWASTGPAPRSTLPAPFQPHVRPGVGGRHGPRQDRRQDRRGWRHSFLRSRRRRRWQPQHDSGHAVLRGALP